MSFDKPQVSSDEQYKKNFTEKERAQHLSVDSAHDMANMMRIEMGVDANGDSSKELHKVDYQVALRDIEELEKLADEQSKGKDVSHRIKEIIQGGGRTLLDMLGTFGISVFGSPDDLVRMKESLKKAKEENKFFDAKKKLDELMKKGEELGAREQRT